MPIIRLDSATVSPKEPEPTPTQPERKRNVLQVFFEAEEDETAQPRTVESEIDDFIKERKLSLSENPLHWWKKNEDHLPLLSKIAKKYLCMTATSIISERVFSAGGNILTK